MQHVPPKFREELVKLQNGRCLLQLENDGRQKTWEVVASN